MELLENGFTAGMKIEIRIPVLHAKAFCDWAVVDDVDNDMILIRLSRDVLPEGVSVRVGQVLECRNINDKRGFSHQAIVVSKGFSQELLLRMIGLIAADERREFFRIDLFLPVCCKIVRNKSSYSLQKQWKQQQKLRKADENARKKKYHETHSIDHRPRLSSSGHPNDGKQHYPLYDESWNIVIPYAVNICGGGFSLVTDQKFKNDDFVLLELLLPSQHRVLDIVARVIFANPNYSVDKEKEYFYVGMQFVFIEESDRSAIVNYITAIQSARIRQMQGFIEEPLYKAENEAQAVHAEKLSDDDQEIVSARFNWLSFALVLIMFILGCLGMFLVQYLMSSTTGTFNEMGKSIEKSFDAYKGVGK